MSDQAYALKTAETKGKNNQPDLISEFMAQHKKSAARGNDDIKACQDAMGNDRLTIDMLTGKKPASKEQLVAALQKDIEQDRQAAGHGKVQGDDQKNIARDNKVVDADQKMLNSGLRLSEAQRQALLESIRTHQLDSRFSQADIGHEKSYIVHDQALIRALKSGHGIEEAKKAVLADRRRDLKNEPTYIANDRAMKAANDKVLKLFGNVHFEST